MGVGLEAKNLSRPFHGLQRQAIPPSTEVLGYYQGVRFTDALSRLT